MTILEFIILVLPIPLASIYFINNLNHGSAFLIAIYCAFIYTFITFLCTGIEILGGLFQLSTLLQGTPLEESYFLLFTPIIVYSNSETNIPLILSNNKNKAGIYMWTHIESGKFYIGSAEDLSKRFKNYFNKSYLDNNKSMYINKALFLHGYLGFTLAILEYIDILNLSKEEARQLILSREQYYLDLIFSEDKPNTYNILKKADSRLGKTHSTESIEKMSLAKSGKNNPMFGKFLTAELITKLSKAKIGENNPYYNKTGEDHPASKKIFVYLYHLETKETTQYKSFETCTEAAKYFKCCNATISYYLNKNKLFKKHWILSTSEFK